MKHIYKCWSNTEPEDNAVEYCSDCDNNDIYVESFQEAAKLFLEQYYQFRTFHGYNKLKDPATYIIVNVKEINNYFDPPLIINNKVEFQVIDKPVFHLSKVIYE